MKTRTKLSFETNTDPKYYDEVASRRPVNWYETVGTDAKTRYQAIAALLHKCPDALSMLFSTVESTPNLMNEPEALKRSARQLPRQTEILSRVALDFWNGSGNTQLIELVEGLDLENFRTMIECLCYLKQETDRQAQ